VFLVAVAREEEEYFVAIKAREEVVAGTDILKLLQFV
jgi:hypothetical protein